MIRWLNRHRVALGYVLVATLFTGLGLLVIETMPMLEAELASRGYEMEAPELLWLAAGIPVLWFVRLHTLTDMPLVQGLLSVTLRSVMVLALVVALTRITHVSHESRKTATVMVVDVSDSVSDEVLEHAGERLQQVWDAAAGDHIVRLVTFAKAPRVVPLVADEAGRLPAVERHSKDEGLASDLQQAMRLAYGLFPPGHHKRLVVVTDGNENDGNALAEVETAVRLGIRIYHHTLPEFEPKPEIMVTGLDVPEEIEPNVPFEVSAQLAANHVGKTKCTLKVDDLVAGARPVDFEVGESTVEFEKVRVREGGDHSFRVDCEPATGKDRFASNNHFEIARWVKEKKKLLYVEGEALYSRAFRDALRDDFDVEVRGAGGLPRTMSALQKYKAVVISDVPRERAWFAQNMTTAQMKLLHGYARKGGMLVFTGGHDSLGPGGYGNTYLERRVLPVKLDVEHELETPRLALVLVIDKSGSMSGTRLELAKKAARATLGELDKRDKVGVVAFDSGAVQLIKLRRATAKSYFDRKLRRLNAGGGTNIHEALDKAFELLDGVEAKVKHVILLTDGQSNRRGVLHLVEDAADNKITVSAIAVGAGSDRTLLAQIAKVGGGRFYYTESAAAVPQLFVNETREVAGESVVEESVRAVLSRKFANLRFLRGVGVKGAPPLRGYVPTQAKNGVDVIMRTSSGDPLLVRHKRGKGWVYVWTSDIKNKWGRRWLRWSGFAGFWRQLIKDGIYEEERETEFPIEVEVARHTLRIGTDAIDQEDRFVSGVTAKAVVTDPTGETKELTLVQSAAGRYEAELPIARYGPWSVDVTHEKDGEKLAVSRGRAAYPWPEEHMRFEPDMTRVQALTANTGGRADPSPALLLKADGLELTRRAPMWHWLLYLVLAAFLVDVLLRRVRLWPTRTQRWGAEA